MPAAPMLEQQWRQLLREIRLRNVVPVVGPSLIQTIDEQGNVKRVADSLAPKLAEQLGLANPAEFNAFNVVARDYISQGGERKFIYSELGNLLENLGGAPSESLNNLAKIKDFDLFVACTNDGLLAQAVAQENPSFSMQSNVIRFHPNGLVPSNLLANDQIESACDLPKNIGGPCVYHILGDYTLPDFAVWEEDYIEFICGLIENRDTLPNLFQFITNKSLLFLGSPSEDWIVRFFLRAARGKRLSETPHAVYLADHHHELGEHLVLFFNHAIKSTQIINGDPVGFVNELFERWSLTYTGDSQFLDSIPDEMPNKSVFISYSHDDSEIAIEIASCLARAGVPVWLDKKRLRPGEEFDTRLEYAVKFNASFFISLISTTTEGDADRYVHQERNWASTRHVPSYVFYIPYEISPDLEAENTLEPACFRGKHREQYSPESLPAFVRTVKGYWEQYQLAGHPRD